ncbi:hypothetical protein Taro_011888 [Colocasia esculenta]|uniref:Uncharacterized protein n=1 Tax=Colocasia esculenta TaxID=4460 RepID=A0A843U796_COLES|nr:hypothetical protein [Colocasia esculenta]
MTERSRQWFLIAAGAVLGSVSTVAMLKLIARSFGNVNTVQSHRLSADCLAINGNVGLPKQSTVVTDKLTSGDSLQDEIVSEQLTR